MDKSTYVIEIASEFDTMAQLATELRLYADQIDTGLALGAGPAGLNGPQP